MPHTVIDDATAHPLFELVSGGSTPPGGYRSLALLPIVLEDRLAGMLVLGFRGERERWIGAGDGIPRLVGTADRHDYRPGTHHGDGRCAGVAAHAAHRRAHRDLAFATAARHLETDHRLAIEQGAAAADRQRAAHPRRHHVEVLQVFVEVGVDAVDLQQR